MAGPLELRLLSGIQKAVCCAAKEQTPSVVIWQQEITDASGVPMTAASSTSQSSICVSGGSCICSPSPITVLDSFRNI